MIFLLHGLGGILAKEALARSLIRTLENVKHPDYLLALTCAVLFF